MIIKNNYVLVKLLIHTLETSASRPIIFSSYSITVLRSTSILSEFSNFLSGEENIFPCCNINSNKLNYIKL